MAEREGRQLVVLTLPVQRIGQNVNEVALLLNGTGEIARHAQAPITAAQRAITALGRSADTEADDGVVPWWCW